MTSTPIAKVNSAITNALAGGRSGKQESSEVDFGLFINQVASSAQENLQLQTSTTSKNQKPLGHDSINKDSFNSVQEKIPQKETDSVKTEKLVKETEDLEEYQKEIKESILENLNVSEEELESAMEVLGLQLVDLMKPENLTNLVTQLTGNVEPLELLMNENFQQLFQSIEELTSSLAADLGISLEEVQQLLSNLEQKVSGGTVSGQQVISQIGETEQETAVEVKVQQTKTTDGTELAETLETEVGNVQEDGTEEITQGVKGEQATGATNATESDNTEVEMQGKTNLMDSADADTESTSNTDAEDSDNSDNQNFNNLQNGNTVLGSKTNVVNTMTQALVNSQGNVNAENIMRQIADAVKVNISQESTSMELQLNPENLGKINLQVVAKNGVITAHLAAENEAVKAALENQVVQLRENLNNQGLKVEAIEVTIASHEFERNLEENQQNGQREDGRQNSGDRRRNLNLSDLEAIQGIMSEEENLAVKMMLQGGNTVDYSA